MQDIKRFKCFGYVNTTTEVFAKRIVERRGKNNQQQELVSGVKSRSPLLKQAELRLQVCYTLGKCLNEFTTNSGLSLERGA